MTAIPFPIFVGGETNELTIKSINFCQPSIDFKLGNNSRRVENEICSNKILQPRTNGTEEKLNKGTYIYIYIYLGLFKG